ncbi:hypothetical protein DBY21_10165 [Candidatus Gastranaerophilales bacterium]|nr:MAG: hypothetical protein DBY21_10165 [Candidatus Gastranaerophilales bacterium]
MFQSIENIIDKKENAFIEYFGVENYNKLLEYNGNDVEGANDWIKGVLKDNIGNTLAMLHCIAEETKENDIVQKRLNAVGIL